MWILNPDLVVEPEALDWLLAAAHNHPDAGLIGSRIMYGGSDPLTIWYNGGEMDWDRGGATTHTDMGTKDAEVRASGPHETDYVTGASMLVRSAVFEDAGLLPEDYFLYFEETEYNLSVRAKGWKTIVETRARAYHFKRSSGVLPTPYYIYYFVRNRLVFGLRHSDVSVDRIELDLEEFVSGWRERVERHSPGGLVSYDNLVETALRDGRAGTTGQSKEVGAVSFTPSDMSHAR